MNDRSVRPFQFTTVFTAMKVECKEQPLKAMESPPTPESDSSDTREEKAYGACNPHVCGLGSDGFSN
jgi:hypothetical protein